MLLFFLSSAVLFKILCSILKLYCLICRQAKIMTSTKKLQDITLGQQDCKILGRLTRLWDSKNMRSKSADPLISIDVIIIDENESIFSSYLTLLHISWLKYSCLPLLFHNRAQWCKLLSQRNLQNSFDLYLLKAKDQSIYLQILLQLTPNKGHTSITIKSIFYSSSPTRRSIVLIREEIRSPTMHLNFAHLISYHQKTLHQSHF